MAMKRCANCGCWYKPAFSADRDLVNEFVDQMGFGIVTKIGKGIAKVAGKRDFCCAECKEQWELRNELLHEKKAKSRFKNSDEDEYDDDDEYEAEDVDEYDEDEDEIERVDLGKEIKESFEKPMAEYLQETKNIINDSFKEPIKEAKKEVAETTQNVKDQFKETFKDITNPFKGFFGKKK